MECFALQVLAIAINDKNIVVPVSVTLKNQVTSVLIPLRTAFVAFVNGQSLGAAALGIDCPNIALITERDFIAIGRNCRVLVKGIGVLGMGKGQGGHSQERKKQAFFHR